MYYVYTSESTVDVYYTSESTVDFDIFNNPGDLTMETFDRPTNLTIAPENYAFTFLSARFGQDDPFADMLNKKKKSIISNNISQIKGVLTYSKFPDFILKDPKYNEHLKWYNRPVLSTTTPKSNNEQQRELNARTKGWFDGWFDWLPFFKSKFRGAGYWFWKSAIITHLLEHANTNVKSIEATRHNSTSYENIFLKSSGNNFFFYSDAGDELDFSFWSPLLKVFHDGKFDFEAQHMEHLEKTWTKGNVFEHFNQKDPKDNAWNSGQFEGGGFFAARITPGTRRFFAALERCVSNFDLVNDSPIIDSDNDSDNDNLNDNNDNR
eukprot:Pgem_evm1s1751